jgi:hypothetical protein
MNIKVKVIFIAKKKSDALERMLNEIFFMFQGCKIIILARSAIENRSAISDEPILRYIPLLNSNQTENKSEKISW